MSNEYSGITIIVDQGSKRTIVNIPKADFVETRGAHPPRHTDPLEAFLGDRSVLLPDRLPPFLAFIFRPIGSYTLREETNPMHTTDKDC